MWNNLIVFIDKILQAIPNFLKTKSEKNIDKEAINKVELVGDVKEKFMREENKEFAQEVYDRIFAVTENHHLSLLGTSQAIIETGWGKAYPVEETKNYFGIKPGSKHAFIVHKKSKIRVYPSYEQSIKSWLYLIEESSHYTKAREESERAMRASWAVFLSKVRSVWLDIFTPKFLEVYCPANPEYIDTLKTIWNNLEQNIKQTKPSIPDWMKLKK